MNTEPQPEPEPEEPIPVPQPHDNQYSELKCSIPKIASKNST
jgi:hypothetical protein